MNSSKIRDHAAFFCKNAEMMNWDDMRVALAAARGETLSAAARRLGVNQTTVSRRLAALEEALGARLFHRIEGRLVPTRGGERLLAEAERAESAAMAAEEALAGLDARAEGTVRVTAVPTTATRLLIPAAPRLTARYPNLRVEILGAENRSNLSRREADMALRFDRPGAAGTTLCRRIGRLGYLVYAPADASDPDALPWITYEEASADLPQAHWIARRIGRRGTEETLAPVLVNDAEGVLQAVAAGLGRSLLPRFVGDADPRLRRLGDEPAVIRDLWHLSHPDIRRTKRGEAVAQWLEETVATVSD